MKKRYYKPKISIKHYNISTLNMDDAASQDVNVYDAGGTNNPQYTLGTLNS